MKICLISDVFPPDVGGVQTFSYELAKHLSEDGRIDKVSVITFSDKIHGREFLNKKLDVLRLPKSNFMKRGERLIYNLFKRREYDVFHATTLGLSSFLGSYFTTFFAHKKCFVIVYGLDALSGFKNTKYRFIIKRTFNKVDKIVTFSESTKLKVKEIYRLKADKLKTIYPGVSVPEVAQTQVESLRKKFALSEDDFAVLFVGRLVERKGADDLIRAVGGIDKKEHIKLLVVGEGPEKGKLKKLSSELDMDGQVFFAGIVPYQEIFSFYKLADVFCMPSKFLKEKGDIEGLGIVFLEAQSYGIPVIGTNSGGIPEAIDNNKSGFIVPESSPEAIKEKIMQLKNDEGLYNKMSRNAIKFVRSKFSWKNCIDGHIKLYEDRKRGS